MKPLPKKYQHKEAEHRWQDHWYSHDIYTWDQSATREDTFVIDTPPPTVSGLLHMGHIFSYTQADFIARYQRMKGKTVFYPMGFDDNGLPTERLVEKVKKIRGANMEREAFIKECESVVAEAEEEFRALFKSVALSVDWGQEYQTVSPLSRKISQLSFLDLVQKQKSYRKLQPTLWDTSDRTALAQADVEDKELPGVMNDITFHIADKDGKRGEAITIATTRPELLAACVAVLYHPDDPNAKKYEGKSAITPLFGVRVPLIADDKVDPEKGTGVVMCCTFGDITDIEWWQLHNLPSRVIIDKAGRIEVDVERRGDKKDAVVFQGTTYPFTDDPCGVELCHDDANQQALLTHENCLDIQQTMDYIDQLQGLKLKEAKAKVLELLEAEGLLVKQEEIVHAVKCAERSGTPLEILVTPQWFVKILEEKEALLEKSRKCNWYPKYMEVRLDQWIEGLSWDWCISRQRFFGVPFPVWYSKREGEEDKILFAHPDDLPVDPMVDTPRGYSKEEVTPDPDVMDTWATSSVSPQLSSHGISDDFAVDSERHKKLFPADLRPQAHEIIRSWAFYTLVKAHLHEDSVPWHNLMISGWCLASDKTKMSKSKGNVVTPINLIEEKGADVVRYWASTSRLGADTAYSEDVMSVGKKLVNKVFNASKFAAIQLERLDGKPTTASQDVENGTIYETLDLWILTRLHYTIEKATDEFEKFEYCNARIAIEEFFWKDFCDNYLELVKTRSYDEKGADPKAQQSAIYTIHHCLNALLRLFAPFLPHVTEELYSHIFDEQHQSTKSVHAQHQWPVNIHYPVSSEAAESGKTVVSVLDAIRKLKAAQNVSIKWPLDQVTISAASDANGGWELIEPAISDLKHVTNAFAISWQDETIKDETHSEATEDGHYIVKVAFAENSDAA